MVFSMCLSTQPSIAVCTIIEKMITPEHQPSELIFKIAQLTGIYEKHDLASLIKATQNIWRRPLGSEIEDLQPRFVQHTQKLRQLCNQIGICVPILPRMKAFKYGLVLGGAAATMHARLLFLENLIANGTVTIEQLVLLASNRPISMAAACEMEDVSRYLRDTSHLSTETDIVKALIHSTDLFPIIKKIPMIFTQSVAETHDTRARTGNTVIDWLQTNPQPDTCLAISTAPFICYQHLTLRTLLPASFSIETCGPIDPCMTSDIEVDVCLDSLARALYQYNKWLELNRAE